MADVHFRGNRNQVRALAYRLRDVLTGSQADSAGVMRGFLMAIGFAALSDIKEAYVVKARGGTDAMGIRWEKLSPKTLAYSRRFGPGEQRDLKRAAGVPRGANRRGLLTPQQDREWKQIYGRTLNRMLLSMNEGAAKARAAQVAWSVMKKKGARTKLEVYGNRDVEILRDTGVLLNSLSPGLLGGAGPSATYTPPSGPGGAEQIFEVNAGEVIVGTTVAYASAHQNGNPSKGLPRRQFLPDDNSQIPQSWWDNWTDAGLAALQAGIVQVIRSGAA